MVFDRMEFAGIVRRRERFPYAAYQSLSPTGRNPFGIPFLGGIVVHPIELGPFSFADTIRLIGNLCPLLHTSVDRRKLFESLATDGEEAELRYADRRLLESTKNLFHSGRLYSLAD
jgi:hypothetical protein